MESFYIFKDIANDTYFQAYPLYTHFSEYLKTEGIPKWTFRQGMGQNMFPGEINNPFLLILYLVGPDLIPYAFGYVECLKIFLGGVVFYFYLKTIGVTPLTQFVGGILFAFSGYMIAGSSWYGHSMIVFSGAFLLFAFERLYKKKQWIVFPFAVILLSSRSFFYLIPFGFFMVIYSLMRCWEEETHVFRKWLILSGKMAILVFLGLGINGFFAIHDIMRLMESPRVSGEAGFIHQISLSGIAQMGSPEQLVTALSRSFSNDLLGGGTSFSGWSNYLEAPLFYCGLITLLLIAQSFGVLNKRKRIIYSIILLFWFIVVIFPFFRYLFYLFSGDYYKGGISFFVPVTMIYIGMRTFDHIDRKNVIHLRILFLSFIAFLSVLSFPFFIGSMKVDMGVFIAIIVFLIMHFILIRFITDPSLQRMVKVMVVLLVLVEVCLLSYWTVNERYTLRPHELKMRVGHNDYTMDALKYIEKREKPSGFYRIEKDYTSGIVYYHPMNDAQIQKYYGTRSYYSFNQKYYIHFLSEMGAIDPKNESDTRWCKGFYRFPLLQSIGSVKYHLNKRSFEDYLPYGFQKIGQFNDVSLLENSSYLPFGYTYDHILPMSDLKSLSFRQRQCILFYAAIVDDKEAESMPQFSSSHIPEKPGIDFCLQPVEHLKEEVFKITSFKQNQIRGTFHLNSKKLAFFSIPYDRGWHAVVNGMPQPLIRCQIGFMGLMLEKGDYEIELWFQPRGYYWGLLLSGLFALGAIILFGYRFFTYGKC